MLGGGIQAVTQFRGPAFRFRARVYWPRSSHGGPGRRAGVSRCSRSGRMNPRPARRPVFGRGGDGRVGVIFAPLIFPSTRPYEIVDRCKDKRAGWWSARCQVRARTGADSGRNPRSALPHVAFDGMGVTMRGRRLAIATRTFASVLTASLLTDVTHARYIELQGSLNADVGGQVRGSAHSSEIRAFQITKDGSRWEQLAGYEGADGPPSGPVPRLAPPPRRSDRRGDDEIASRPSIESTRWGGEIEGHGACGSERICRCNLRSQPCRR